MDALYLYEHSGNDDFEIRYSLRSVAQHAPYIRKVWIFGDRPKFLSDDTSIVEHVPHAYVARLTGVRTPVKNFFLMMFLSSLIPELEYEYLRFSDDYYLVKDYPIEEARKDRYSENLSQLPVRGRGRWMDSLWRTYDLLMRLGYTGYNFEIHAPIYLTKKRVLDAYCEFRDFITEDRWYGMLGATAILNHAHKQENMPLISILEKNSRFGFWDKPPAYEEILRESKGKMFFNFNETAFGPAICQFLMERFPKRSRYEKA